MVTIRGARILLCALAVLAASPGLCQTCRDFLNSPPVYVVSEPDIPLSGFGIGMPAPNQLVPDFDLVSLDSDRFAQDGVTVQPGLSAKFDTLRLGLLRGFKNGWAAGLSMPWQRTQVGNVIGGLPASNNVTAIGDMFLGAKKVLWSSGTSHLLVGAVGIELPTGMDHATFDQSNAVTNAYYRGFPRRMPLSWQTGSGTVDALVGISYGRLCNRLSYEGLAVMKLNGSGDEDVHIGNTTLIAATATYGIARRVAFSLGLTLRSQRDDAYPNAPPPGVNQPALAGTTTHGATLYLDPSVRFTIGKLATVGVGFRLPLVDPDDGLVPRGLVSILFYPSF